MWLVGDEFLHDMMFTFHVIKAQAAQHNKALPYLYQNYNVISQDPPKWSNTRAFLARVFNALVKALNESPFILLRYILIMLDKDLISNADLYDFWVSHTIEDTIKWLLVNINQVLKTHKEDLARK